jgi:hypothetical protein
MANKSFVKHRRFLRGRDEKRRKSLSPKWKIEQWNLCCIRESVRREEFHLIASKIQADLLSFSQSIFDYMIHWNIFWSSLYDFTSHNRRQYPPYPFSQFFSRRDSWILKISEFPHFLIVFSLDITVLFRFFFAHLTFPLDLQAVFIINRHINRIFWEKTRHRKRLERWEKVLIKLKCPSIQYSF